jgi:hypothetical protein
MYGRYRSWSPYWSAKIRGMRLVAIFFTLSLVASAQQPAPVPPAKTQSSDMLEHWRRATVALGQVYVIGGKKTFVTNGSAVIVAVSASQACLLTAKHMFFNPSEGYIPTQISMRLPQEGPVVEEDLGVVIPLIINGQALWKTSRDESDLAVVQLPDLSKYKNVNAVGLQDFGTSDDVFQSASIMVLGYPGILGEHYQTTPIARGGMIAWTDPDNPDTKPFLVDANVFQGNSGGPVFHIRNGFDRHGNLNLGGGFEFIGIMSQDAQEYSNVLVTNNVEHKLDKLNTPNPINQKPESILAEVKNIGGIGVVEPVAVIKELLEDAYGKPRGFFSKPENIPTFKPPVKPISN